MTLKIKAKAVQQCPPNQYNGCLAEIQRIKEVNATTLLTSSQFLYPETSRP